MSSRPASRTARRKSSRAILLALAPYPTAASINIDPWVVAMVVMLGTNMWLYPQQNVNYQPAFYASGERAFSHSQARPLSFVCTAAVFVAIFASIPYWRWLGLIG